MSLGCFLTELSTAEWASDHVEVGQLVLGFRMYFVFFFLQKLHRLSDTVFDAADDGRLVEIDQ